jgi:thiol-disulfide isomerase/thioredoxin
MKYLFSVLVLVLCFHVFAQDRSIEFETKLSFSELVQKAKNENKLLFIDAYTTWCGPCKWMAKNMFTKNEIADYYNLNFINAKFDMEKGEGIELAKKFQVLCYPNLLFIDGNGELVHRTGGAAQFVENYIQFGEIAKNDEARFSTLLKKYESNKNDSKFLANFIDAIAATCLPYEEFVSIYFSLQKDEDLVSDLNWYMLGRYMNSHKNREFKYLIANIEKFEKAFTKEEVHEIIEKILINSAQKLIFSESFSKEKLAELKSEIEALNFENKKRVIFKINIMEHEKDGDSDAMFDYVVKEGDKFLDMSQYNSISWSIFEKSTNEKHLNKAAEWMKALTVTEDGKTWENLDTYASLLFKLKDKKRAKIVALEAIEIAKKSQVPQEDYKATEELILKIDKLK